MTLPGGPDGIVIAVIDSDTAHRLGPVDDDVFDAGIDPARLAAYVANPLNHLVVAIADGRVVGQARATILLQPDGPSQLCIDNLGVAPAYRRRGIARALLQAVFDWGRAQGCDHCWVGTETDEESRPARRLYESLSGTGETFVLYVHKLTPPQG